MKKAYFFPRLIAYFIDIIIISFVASLITLVLPDNNQVKLQEESLKIQENYLEGKISQEEYINQTALVTYDLDHALVLNYIVEIIITVLYFVVFQFYNKGQTLGKKLMKIRVVSNTDNELTVNDYLFRSMIMYSVLVNILVVILAMFMSRDYYFFVSYPLQFVQIVLILITIFMILFKKDARGLHDLVGHTKVVMVD